MSKSDLSGLNNARGEIALVLDGRSRKLCLTLGALAEIETGLCCQNLPELQTRLREVSARDLLLILSALLRGGGEDEAVSNLSSSDLDIGAATDAIAACFRQAGA